MDNNNLHTAKKEKNDEFYTQYEDIENEVEQYADYLEGKWVYSPCDDYRWSNFTKYFTDNFHRLKLKHFTCTNYDTGDGAFRYDYDGFNKVITKIDDGDFRGDYSKALLDEADVIVTNPPFSLFREYIAQLIEYEKYFLVLGNNNAVTYKEIFPLIKDNKMWLGYSANKTMEFEVPEGYKFSREENGKKYGKVPAITWYTNIPTTKRSEKLVLGKHYKPEDYPKYDNYDAIEVAKVVDIPCDYDGVMGVPITFLDKYCPEQFEIVGMMSGGKDKGLINGNDGRLKFYLNNKGVYARILIKKK